MPVQLVAELVRVDDLVAHDLHAGAAETLVEQESREEPQDAHDHRHLIQIRANVTLFEILNIFSMWEKNRK